jgi:hypothetical protein
MKERQAIQKNNVITIISLIVSEKSSGNNKPCRKKNTGTIQNIPKNSPDIALTILNILLYL